MPISHENHLIFVHIPSTGGSSIERMFSIFGDRKIPNMKMLFGFDKCLNRYLQHLTLSDIKEIVPEDIFQSYFKFSVVRNPWAKMVSEYHYFSRDRSELSFPLFVQKRINSMDQHFLEQYKFIVDESGDVAVDLVCRFENIQTDIRKVFERFDMPKTLLSRSNGRHYDHYSTYYDDTARELVAERYKKDIELFKYSYSDLADSRASETSKFIDETIRDRAVVLLETSMKEDTDLQLYINDTYSMEPFFKENDILFIRKVSIGKIVKGDIVAYRTKRGICVHRCVKIIKSGRSFVLRTKGDNLFSFDSGHVTEKELLGVEGELGLIPVSRV